MLSFSYGPVSSLHINDKNSNLILADNENSIKIRNQDFFLLLGDKVNIYLFIYLFIYSNIFQQDNLISMSCFPSRSCANKAKQTNLQKYNKDVMYLASDSFAGKKKN